MKKLSAVLLVLALLLSMAASVMATEAIIPKFSYELLLTDGSGMPVSNPRSLSAGDTLNVEIVLTRTDVNTAYTMFGIEFRLLTQGLEFNNDGSTLRSGTAVRGTLYSDGLYTGFAWYDLKREGEPVNNPVLAGRWSYTVTDPAIVNIRVPVALLYVPPYTEEFIPTSNAQIQLDFTGSKLDGVDISGTYLSGTVVTLPTAVMGDYVFLGWTDGASIFPAGSEYVVTGIVTLTPVFEELERNRHLNFDAQGGEILGEDPTGMYADGEIVTIPDAARDGYTLIGWDDGTNVYLPGDEYTVYNTVILRAQWEKLPDSTTDPSAEPTTDPTEPTTPEPVPTADIGVVLMGLGGILGLLWIILIFWKRRWVRYSLVNGDIALSFKDKEHDVQVAVLLIDQDKVKHSLGKSGTVPAGKRLTFIKNVAQLPVVQLEKGKYEGFLIVTRGTEREAFKCRIKVLDKELKDSSK